MPRVGVGAGAATQQPLPKKLVAVGAPARDRLVEVQVSRRTDIAAT